MNKVKMLITFEVDNPFAWQGFKNERHKIISQFGTDIVEYKGRAGLNDNGLVAVSVTCTDLDKMEEVMNSDETGAEMKKHGVYLDNVRIYHDFEYEDTIPLPDEDKEWLDKDDD